MLEYVFQRGMLTRGVVRLVETLSAECNRAAASRRAGLAQWYDVFLHHGQRTLIGGPR